MGRYRMLVVTLLVACAPLEEGQADDGGSDSAGSTSTSPGPTTSTASSATSTLSGSETASASGSATMNGSTETGETASTTEPVTVTLTDTEPPMTSTTEEDGSVSSSSDDGDDDDDGTSSSTTTGDACGLLDPEDNDDQNTPTDLPDLGCDDGPASYDASLEPGDADWFHVYSPWDCGNVPNPVVEVSVDIDAAVCAYVSCTAPMTVAVVLCAAGANATAPNGELGCCGDGAVELDVNCAGGGDESLDVWMSVDTGPATCTDYAITYEVTAV